MKLEEALNILDQVCAVHQGVRQEHVALQQAMQVVTEATKPSTVPQTAAEKKEAQKEKKESDGNKK